jgi:hypothetical protein
LPSSTTAGDGNVDLLVRLLNVDDPSTPGQGLQEVAINNNIAMRPVQVCAPAVCAQQSCGSFGDGCGATLDCGSCPAGQVCGGQKPNVCCAPQCPAGACGSDGCGGQCGACPSDQVCRVHVCVPADPCASCSPDEVCIDRRCVVPDCQHCPPGFQCLGDNKCARCPGGNCQPP